MKKGFKWFKRFVVGVCVVVLLVVLPGVKLGSDKNLSLIYNVFVGAKSKYQGIIEVWNIDTFESGSISKTNIINSVAKTFQSKNKGLFILTRNITETECLNMLASGKVPDIFSCSYGVASEIYEYLQPYQNTRFDLYDNFIKAGQDKFGNQMGIAWCVGNYYLISTRQNLEKAKVADIENVSLIDIALTSGYVVKGKKNDKIVYSLGFGEGKYLVPQKAMTSYNDSGELLISENSVCIENVSQSSYSAYCKFLAGENVVLLGTQRDVIRMRNREMQGKVLDVIVQPLTKFTDLVQFAFLGKSDDQIKNEYKEKFVEMLAGEVGWTKVLKSDMFSGAKVDFNDFNGSVMQDIVLENIANYEIFNAFLEKEEIDKLQNDSIEK